MNAPTDLATLAIEDSPPTPMNISTAALVLDNEKMRTMMAFADMMAASAVTVPKHLQGKPADCLAIAMQAAQWGMNPFAVAQKTHVVNGTLGYEAQLVNAVIQSTGAIVGTPSYEYRGSGQDLECRVGCVRAGESAITWGEWLRNGDVKTRNSPLWATNPKQQLGYLQLKNWARLYAPGAILGVYTPDELEQVPAAEAPRGPQRASATAAATAGAPLEMAERVDTATGEVGAPAPAATPAAPPPPAAAATPNGGISGGQVAYLRNKLKAAGVAEQSICDRFQVASIEVMRADDFDTLKSELLANT
jgi:hypothetical protein